MDNPHNPIPENLFFSSPYECSMMNDNNTRIKAGVEMQKQKERQTSDEDDSRRSSQCHTLYLIPLNISDLR